MSTPENLIPLFTALLLPLYLLSSMVLVAHPRLRMSPLPIFAGMWLAFYFVYLLGVSDSSFAAVYVLGLLALVNLGGWLGYRLSFPVRTSNRIEQYLLWPRAIIWTTVLLGIVVNIYLAITSGIEISGPRSLLALPDWYASQRYQAGEGIPFAVRIANALTFAGTMFASVIFSDTWQGRGRTAWAALLPGFNIIIYGMIIGSKAPIIFAFIYYLNGYFISCLYHGTRANVARMFIGISLAVAITIALAITAQYFRSGGNISVLDIIARIATSYFFVPPALLIEWLESAYLEVGLGFDLGIKTFQGVSSYIVDEIREHGGRGYVELFGREYSSTVYTAFRWIITDYGLIAAPLVVTTGAAAMGRAIKRLSHGDVRALVLFFFIGNLLLFSFAGSPYKYTSHVVSIVLVYTYVVLSAARFRKKPIRS